MHLARRRSRAEPADAQISEVNLAQVLLTHSYHLPYDAKQLRKMQPYTPIGTLYAASGLRDRGISVAAFDSMLEDPSARFTAVLETHQPKIVAVYEDDFNFLSKMVLDTHAGGSLGDGEGCSCDRCYRHCTWFRFNR